MTKTFYQWLKEMAGTGAIVGSCKSTPDYNVWGACSDLKRKKKKKLSEARQREDEWEQHINYILDSMETAIDQRDEMMYRIELGNLENFQRGPNSLTPEQQNRLSRIIVAYHHLNDDQQKGKVPPANG